eukprot:PhM_4_TR9545/c0_g1_i2/m.34217
MSDRESPVDVAVASLILCAQKNVAAGTASQAALDSILEQIELLKKNLEGGTVPIAEGLANLTKHVEVASASSRDSASALQRETSTFTSIVSEKFAAYEEFSNDQQPDVVSSSADGALSHELRNRSLLHLIYDQLLHDGYLDIASEVATHTTDVSDCAKRQQYVELHDMLRCILDRDVAKPIEWCKEFLSQAEALQKRNGSSPDIPRLHQDILTDGVADLCFELHWLRALSLVMGGRRSDAVEFVRREVTPLTRSCRSKRSKVNQLLTSMVFMGGSTQVPSAPYEWLGPTSATKVWQRTALKFMVTWCARYQMADRPALELCVEAGHHVYPLLHKYMALPFRSDDAALQLESMPRDLTFHSWVCCPVTHVLATKADDDNPPVLLPCGHVFSEHALRSLGRYGSHRIKCAYCPLETDRSMCVRLKI